LGSYGKRWQTGAAGRTEHDEGCCQLSERAEKEEESKGYFGVVVAA
jgi:hypothetical protein